MTFWFGNLFGEFITWGKIFFQSVFLKTDKSKLEKLFIETAIEKTAISRVTFHRLYRYNFVLLQFPKMDSEENALFVDPEGFQKDLRPGPVEGKTNRVLYIEMARVSMPVP